MDTDVQNGDISVKTEFIQAIKDFSQYLSGQKKSGHTFLKISKDSEVQINNWGEGPGKDLGKDLGKKIHLQQPFFFQGSENADIFIIDSGVDFFKGKSGELLIKILAAMKLTTDCVFICNAGDMRSVHVKIQTVSPKVIIALGTKAGQLLTNSKQTLETLRGNFYEYKGIKVMPTYHPSLLLKHPAYKRQVWDDIQKVMKLSGIQNDF
jgi:uracil-DNA glycosylase